MDKNETQLFRDELTKVLARIDNADATNASPDQVQAWKRRTRELRDWILESQDPFVGAKQPARWVELRPGLKKLVRE